MTSKLLLPVVLAGFILPSFTYADNATAPSTQDQNAAPAAAAPVTDQSAQGQQTDVDAVLFIKKTNQHELALADLAESKAKNPAVKDFAKMMKTQHSKNLQDLMKFSKDMKEEAQTDDKSFKDLSDNLNNAKDFDLAYIQAMVSGHQEALDKIDALVGNISNPELKQFVKETRDVVKSHLDAAKGIEETLQKAPAAQ